MTTVTLLKTQAAPESASLGGNQSKREWVKNAFGECVKKGAKKVRPAKKCVQQKKVRLIKKVRPAKKCVRQKKCAWQKKCVRLKKCVWGQKSAPGKKVRRASRRRWRRPRARTLAPPSSAFERLALTRSRFSSTPAP